MFKENIENYPKKNKFKYILRFIFILIIALGIFTGISIAKWQNLASDMMQNTSSIILDSEEKIIATLGAEKNRRNIKISDIPDNLINAYISIEDERFYVHNGIDIKRTTAAILNYITKKNSTFGGSTITQQLVKNLSADRDTTIRRKISEWFRAFSLELAFSKEEILEAYLNVIYVGPNMYGVEIASQYYFNKNVKDLSLLECAYIAGINHSPNAYNPFDKENDYTEKIHSRIKTVLSKMKELGYISEEEYLQNSNNLDESLSFKKGTIENTNSNIYSYHTDALITEITEDLANQKNISLEFASNYLQTAGLKIYSTQDSSIQKIMEDEFSKTKYIIKSKNDSSITSQAAMVIIDQSTGRVVGCVGGLGQKDSHRGFNRATQAIRQTGSASKPLAVLAPALDKKIITAASKIIDEPTTFSDNTEEGYSPANYNDYLGEITVRRAVESSQNIPFVKIMEQVTPQTGISYMKEMGITTLTEVDNNINLALGGLDKGISPLEMAGAYATIANKGIYLEPSFYTNAINSLDKIVVKSKQERHRAISKDVALILTSLLTEPVNGKNGTATYCAIPNIEVAAKTGTTNDNYDRWLCGYTPYYTCVSWYGFDISESINYNHQNPAGLLWSSVMNQIHNKLEPSNFSNLLNSNLERITICNETGLYATDNCKNTYSEYFLKGTVPEVCNKH